MLCMGSHVQSHFLFRTGIAPIAKLMRRSLTGYAISFNHRHRRHGQLFQNRYKSIVCQEDVCLRELVRYIHLNPVRARLVSELWQLDKYPYCGHSSLYSHPCCCKGQSRLLFPVVEFQRGLWKTYLPTIKQEQLKIYTFCFHVFNFPSSSFNMRKRHTPKLLFSHF